MKNLVVKAKTLETFNSKTFATSVLYRDGKFVVKTETVLGENIKEFETFEEALNEFEKTKEELLKREEELTKKEEKEKKRKTALANELMKAIEKYNTILLYGPTGTGKTETSLAVAEAMKEEGKFDEVLLFTMSSGMDDIDLLGKFIPQEDRSLKFIPSAFLRAIESASLGLKVAIILDEFNRASPKTLNILLPLFDRKDGKYRLNNYLTGEIIEIPVENIKFILTANFGGSYAGTYAIDPALLNRMEYVRFVDYQADVEENIISENAKDPDKVKEVIEFFRELAKNGEIYPFTTRDTKFVASLDEITFETLSPVIYKLVKQDNLGYPDEDTLNVIKEFLEKLYS